jgi:hypothetical protein
VPETITFSRHDAWLEQRVGSACRKRSPLADTFDTELPIGSGATCEIGHAGHDVGGHGPGDVTPAADRFRARAAPERCRRRSPLTACSNRDRLSAWLTWNSTATEQPSTFVLTVEESQSDTVWSLVNAEWDALQTRFEQLAAQHGFELDPEPSFDWRRE